MSIEEAWRLWGAGRRTEAMAACETALAGDPRDVAALLFLGSAQMQTRQAAAAVTTFNRAVALDGENAHVRVRLALARWAVGDLPGAIADLRVAASVAPTDATVLGNLGSALYASGEFEAAEQVYRKLMHHAPDNMETHVALGLALQAAGDLAGATGVYRNALQRWPQSYKLHHNLGTALRLARELPAARASLEQALRLRPDSARAHYNLGVTLRDQQILVPAIDAFRRALVLQPDYPMARCELVRCAMQVGEWHLVTEEAPALRAAIRAGATISPHNLLGLSDDPSEQLAAARACTRAVAPHPSEMPRRASRSERIRIAYLSSDFHEHATAYLLAEVFELHDRSTFEVLGISYGPDDGSAMRGRLRAAFEEFVDVRPLSDRAVATLLADRGIDIAIDLKGHTGGARLNILAGRPAPVQVAYLGFPGTSGAPFIDYILADDFVIPEADRQFFSEEVVYLPDCYQANDRKRPLRAPELPRSTQGLPADGFVFCCFNSSWKIGPEIFAVWLRLLGQVPGSVLWLLASNPSVPARLRAEAERAGISGSRIVYSESAPLAEHLARHAHADLFLDTVPCNAHTTASDSLWAGLPLITCAARSFAGRVAGSLLRAAGLSELITQTLPEYEQLALALARDPGRLTTLRDRLRRAHDSSALFDAPRFCRHLESALTTMCERQRAGLSPKGFRVTDEHPIG